MRQETRTNARRYPVVQYL